MINGLWSFLAAPCSPKRSPSKRGATRATYICSKAVASAKLDCYSPRLGRFCSVMPPYTLTPAPLDYSTDSTVHQPKQRPVGEIILITTRDNHGITGRLSFSLSLYGLTWEMVLLLRSSSDHSLEREKRGPRRRVHSGSSLLMRKVSTPWSCEKHNTH